MLSNAYQKALYSCSHATRGGDTRITSSVEACLEEVEQRARRHLGRGAALVHVDQPFCHVDRAVVVAVVRAQESVGGGVLKLTKLGEVELAGTVPVSPAEDRLGPLAQWPAAVDRLVPHAELGGDEEQRLSGPLGDGALERVLERRIHLLAKALRSLRPRHRRPRASCGLATSTQALAGRGVESSSKAIRCLRSSGELCHSREKETDFDWDGMQLPPRNMRDLHKGYNLQGTRNTNEASGCELAKLRYLYW